MKLRKPESQEELVKLLAMRGEAAKVGGLDPYSDSDEVECLLAVDEQAGIVGFVGYHSYRSVFQRCRVALWIDPDCRGRGYGKQAHLALNDFLFDTMNIHRIEGAVLDANGAMRHVCERVGMTMEGHLRQAAFHDGGFHSYVQYAILKTDRS